MTKSTLSSHNNHNNGTGHNNYNSNNNYNNLNINSYNYKGYNNKNSFKYFSNGNVSSLSHKKLGIKVKKKALKSTGEENNKDNYMNNNYLNKSKENNTDANTKKKLNKLIQINLFKNYNKFRTFVIWREYIHQNTFEYKYLTICELVENKIIKNYYHNNIIKKYNSIKSEEKIWEMYPIPENFLDIDEKNKDDLLLNLYEKALSTYKNLVFNNNKILTSVSIYIFEKMVNKIFSNLKKVRFIMKYYYDKEKKAIIKKPSVTVIKEILNKLSKIIERPIIKNKIAQEFIGKTYYKSILGII